MDKVFSSHSPLTQATISYAVTPAERQACWEEIDATAHPALPHLLRAFQLHLDRDKGAARSAMDAALELVSAELSPDLYTILITNEARMFSSQQGASAAIQRLSTVEDLLDRTSPDVRMAAIWRLGTLCRTAGRLSDAFKHFTAASVEAEHHGWDHDTALLISELGSLYVETGDPVKAIGCFEESHHLLRRSGEHHLADRILLNLALAHGRVGQLDQAEALMEEAVARQRKTQEFRYLAGGLLNLAVLKKRLGKIDEASAIYSEMLQRTTDEPPSMERVRALIGAASVHNEKGDNGQALELLDQARAVAAAKELAVTVLDIDSKRADVYRDAGQKDHAVDLLQETFDALRQHTYTHHTVEVGALLEQWLVEDGRQDQAYEILKVCSDLQKEVYRKESERALELSTVRQTMEAERRDLHLREEERRSLLHQVLPQTIADRVMAGERRIADQLEMVGILFADIVGFTHFASGKTPSEVLEDLEALFQAIDKLIGKHDCEKIKTIGDSYMATNGTSAERTSEAPSQAIARLARCGLDMLDLLAQPELAHIELRVGMHAGPVVAGVMAGMRLAYDMWGDTVNVASRMESTSVAGQLQITKEVADLLQTMNEFVITPREAITVRGRGEMVTFWITRA